MAKEDIGKREEEEGQLALTAGWMDRDIVIL